MSPEYSQIKLETISKYLKPLIRLMNEGSNEWFSTKYYCKIFNVHPSTVTEHFQKLNLLGIVDYEKYKGIKLTKMGLEIGSILMRKHRILEYFFVNELGLSKAEACEEAEKIDLFISEKIIDKLCNKYAHPKVCPCGNEIYHLLDKDKYC